jgi:hypothetical protein
MMLYGGFGKLPTSSTLKQLLGPMRETLGRQLLQFAYARGRLLLDVDILVVALELPGRYDDGSYGRSISSCSTETHS